MAHKSFFKHDTEPLSVTRAKRRSEAERLLREAYDVVDHRDGGRCWITGRQTQPHAASADVRREHHHLVTRQDKERRADPDNIVTLCAAAHHLVTHGWIVVEGTDATKPLRFHWREDIKPEQKTLRIQSRRWSQNVEMDE